MKIKQNHEYQAVQLSKSKSKKHDLNQIKASIKSSARHVVLTKQSKEKENLKCLKNYTKMISRTNSPPCFKRQTTQESLQDAKISKNFIQIPQLSKENRFNQSNKKNRQLERKKINSDQQSTNVYLYNKQSADQQLDPYKISTSNPFCKEKSIKPSRDLSISIMCNIEPKHKVGSDKMTENFRSSKNQSPSIQELKSQINKKIESFKSLTKLHEQESEYFTTKIGISKEQQKRLQKIQLIEINSVKSQIFHLRDEIQNKFIKSK